MRGLLLRVTQFSDLLRSWGRGVRALGGAFFPRRSPIFGLHASSKLPSGHAFVSYAYEDEEALEQLVIKLRTSSVTPLPFPPINVPPSEMVSNRLIESIMSCRSLVYIDTPNSRVSRWVSLEREYARHIGKPVFSYKPEAEQLKLDIGNGLDLPVFPSYTSQQREKVQWIIKFMRKERFFDIFNDIEDLNAGAKLADEIALALHDRLSRGGYTVIFWSHEAEQSLWMKQEVERSLVDFPNQVLVALLEDVAPPKNLTKRQPIMLFGEGPYGLDHRRVDDLIVSLYWLMQERGSSSGRRK